MPFDETGPMRVVVLHPPQNPHAMAWIQSLGDRGHSVRGIVAPTLTEIGSEPLPDLVIGLVLVRDVLHPSSGRYIATRPYEHAGVPTLNSSASIAISSDKAATYAVFKQAGLDQPETWPLEAANTWPGDGGPLVLKPAFSAGGRQIHLVEDLLAARFLARDWDGPAILQEHIGGAVCVRVIATREQVFTAVEKRVAPGTLVAAIGRGAEPVYIEPTDEMSTLATSMVQASGGTLMGVDILVTGDRLIALEANVPFAFNLERPSLMTAMTDLAERVAGGQSA